jgi:hypothetical protein
MITHLARLLDITINNVTIPSNWKRAIVAPICKGAIAVWSQFNLSGRQANGTQYISVSEENLVQGLDIPGSTRISAGIFMRKSNNHGFI